MISTYTSLNRKYIHVDLFLIRITVSKASIVVWIWDLCLYWVDGELGSYVHREEEE